MGALNPIAFKLGPFLVHWYGIIIASGAALGVLLAINETKRQRISADDIYDLVLWALPIGLIGARIYYVIFEWQYYSQHLNEIIAIWQGGIAIYGGLIAGGITLIVFCRQRSLSVWQVLDVVTPGIMLGQVIGRWGNFVNQEAFGSAVSRSFLQQLHLPNFIVQQMYIGGAYHQPTFLYESVWNFIGLILLLSLRHKRGLFKRGEIALSYAIWYSFGRFFIEGMRTDSLYLFGQVRVSQLLSLIVFIVMLSIFVYRRKQQKASNYLID